AGSVEFSRLGASTGPRLAWGFLRLAPRACAGSAGLAGLPVVTAPAALVRGVSSTLSMPSGSVSDAWITYSRSVPHRRAASTLRAGPVPARTPTLSSEELV